jgi:hypothetical protein
MNTRAALIIGLSIVVAAVIMVGVPILARTPRDAEVGRYQFAHTSGVNAFVIDTKTGRLWNQFVAPTSGPTKWSECDEPWLKNVGEAGPKTPEK